MYHGAKPPQQPEPPRVPHALWSRPEQEDPRTVPQSALDLGSQGPACVTLSNINFVMRISRHVSHEFIVCQSVMDEATEIPIDMVRGRSKSANLNNTIRAR